MVEKQHQSQEMHAAYSEVKLKELIIWFRDVQFLTEFNHIYIVEKVRNLSEFLVYGEKTNQTQYFEMFIEENVLQGDLSRFLQFNHVAINIQIIQTMSILVQNIQEHRHLFYILGNPFLNQLITYDFGLATNDELIDYFVNFLKALVLKLDSDTVNFFFNDRLKTFPVFQVATTLYNSKEQLVRTSVRTITLQIFELKNEEMYKLFHVVPFCAFYSNLACHLRDLWINIEKEIDQVTDTED